MIFAVFMFVGGTQAPKIVGYDLQKVQELSVRIKNGDTAAQAEMNAIIFDGRVPKNDAEAELFVQQKMKSGIAKVWPYFTAFFLFSLVLWFLYFAYFLNVVIFSLQDAGVAFQKTFSTVLGLAGLAGWSILRSFVWIPFAGPILAIIFFPKFLLAPIYLLEQNKGIRESTRLSIANTRGYWGKIVGNGILLALIEWVVLIIASAAFGLLGGLGPLLLPVANIAIQAFGTIFAVLLGRSIMEQAKA
jgi:hypothetical protein